jgi:hypothetical protein
VSCKLINFVFHVFPLSAGFMSYIVPDYPHLFSLDPVTAASWLSSFDLTVLNILHETMAYASSSHNTLDFLWLKLLYSNNFPSSSNIHTIT